MFNLLSSFLVGFSCTLFLFVLSFLFTISFKALYLYVKDFSPKKAQSLPEEKKKKKQTNKPKTKSGVIRSVEIDPTQIDKIYVKKSS